MDPLSSRMVRAALLWLLAGVVIGGAMLSGHWAVWLAPTHAHMLFVGWFLQFAIGIAYWLLPRRRSPQRPLGYDERAATLAVVALNLGLVLRVIGEPWQRTGQGNGTTVTLLALSALLQVGAVLTFVLQLWPRLAARPIRKGDAPVKAPTSAIGK